MKRPFSLSPRQYGLVAGGVGLIAATYGLVRFAYGLYLPDVQNDVGLAAPAAGAVAAGASVVYCVAAVAAFAAAPRTPRLVVAAAAVSAAAGAVGMAAAADAAWFGAWAIAGSAGAGLASPALVALVQRNVPRDAQARAQSIVNAGTGPGVVTAGLLALVLLPAWRTGWIVAAAATALAATIVVVLDRPRPDGNAAAPVRLPRRAWFRAHARVIVAALLMGAASAAVWTYGRTLLVNAGMPEPLSVLAWIALGAGGGAVILTARALAAVSPPAGWTFTTALVALSTAAVALLPASAPGALVACAVFGWGYVAASGALIAWTTALDAAHAASGTAMLFVLLVLGQAAGAAVAGMLLPAWGAGATFLLAAIVAAAAAALGLVPHPGREQVAAGRDGAV